MAGQDRDPSLTRAEVAERGGLVLIRDYWHPRVTLALSPAGWQEFRDAVKQGRYDQLSPSWWSAGAR